MDGRFGLVARQKRGGLHVPCRFLLSIFQENFSSKNNNFCHIIRLLWMYLERTVAIDDPVACCFACHFPVPCKTAERIEVLFGLETLGDPWYIVLDGGPDSRRPGGGRSMRSLPNYFVLLSCNFDTSGISLLLQ